jgi:GTP-binding protein
MLPVIALVGRPNVGKSTLFNHLTRSRDALVADRPGLTRDRRYGIGRLGDRPYLVIDTGGLSGQERGLDGEAARQTRNAITEADVVLLLMDAREGLTATDLGVAEQLRPLGKRVHLVLNKVDGLDPDLARAEFFGLGLGEPIAIAAAQGRGVAQLIEGVLAELPQVEEPTPEAVAQRIRIAVVGRPNVGKSTLVNRLLGEERMVTYDHPGTTRDSIEIEFDHEGAAYTLIDTAGIRRRARVRDAIEKFSILKALQAVESAEVVVLVLDAREGIADQDAALAGLVAEAGRALVVAINKWDGLAPELRQAVRQGISRKLTFLDFAPTHFISARHGSGVGELMASTRRAYESGVRDLPTPLLTRILADAVSEHPPPLVRGRRIKLRYAHQGGRSPPRIVVHGNQVESVPEGYRRFLANRFRRELGLVGTPVRIEFKGQTNPYAGRRNVLRPRQIEKKKRLMRFVKGRRR